MKTTLLASILFLATTLSMGQRELSQMQTPQYKTKPQLVFNDADYANLEQKVADEYLADGYELTSLTNLNYSNQDKAKFLSFGTRALKQTNEILESIGLSFGIGTAAQAGNDIDAYMANIENVLVYIANIEKIETEESCTQIITHTLKSDSETTAVESIKFQGSISCIRSRSQQQSACNEVILTNNKLELALHDYKCKLQDLLF